MKLKRISLLFIALAYTFLFSGCSDIQIFEEDVNPYELSGKKDTELKDEVYYVKQNTRFYEVHMADAGNASSEVSALDESRVMATLLDDSLIPTHYSDELIAFQSDKIDFTSVNLERFIDLGYSIGCFNGKLDDDGSLYVSKNDGVVKDSSLAEAIGQTQSNDIRIASIDGKPLSKESVYLKPGVITGLEKNKSYKVGFYVGTHFYEKNIVADTRMYSAYEMFTYSDDFITDTPNGYMCFNTPTELKCGFYNINGKGLFKYYNFTKGSQEEAGINMNESFYKDEKSRIEAYSRQYSISVPKRVKDLKIIVEYNLVDLEYKGDNIEGIVFAPDGERFNMEHDEKNRTLSLSMTEGMAGEWTVNVVPKTLSIKEVKVENDKAAEEATCEETVFNLPEARENIEFIAQYSSYNPNVEDCLIFGNILTEDGRTYEMTTWVDDSDRQNPRYYISYELPYAAAGEYTVRIYHLPEETTIEKPVVEDKVELITDVIVVDG